mmetsp:Transcript_40378/g.54949  ORF Transcript_40378/g.54949 Transcript_40378/m.54949 type:complete len:261 (-) Transcript_40378:37-819(-)
MLFEGLKHLGLVIVGRLLHPTPFDVEDHVLTIQPLQLSTHETIVCIAFRDEGRQDVIADAALDHVTHLGICDRHFEGDWAVYRVLEASPVQTVVFLKPLPKLLRFVAQFTQPILNGAHLLLADVANMVQSPCRLGVGALAPVHLRTQLTQPILLLLELRRHAQYLRAQLVDRLLQELHLRFRHLLLLRLRHFTFRFFAFGHSGLLPEVDILNLAHGLVRFCNLLVGFGIKPRLVGLVFVQFVEEGVLPFLVLRLRECDFV